MRSGQRVPGDYDAQMSIHGGTARHSLEHLASTDRGVLMLQNMIRRAVPIQQGADPRHNSHQAGQDISTYSQDRVLAEIPGEWSPLRQATSVRTKSGTDVAGAAAPDTHRLRQPVTPSIARVSKQPWTTPAPKHPGTVQYSYSARPHAGVVDELLGGVVDFAATATLGLVDVERGGSTLVRGSGGREISYLTGRSWSASCSLGS